MTLEEMKAFENNIKVEASKRVARYLIDRIETDEILRNKLLETKKTINGCINYIFKEAKKQAVSQVAFVEDDVVYGWAVHYFIEDSINEEPNENKPKKEPVKEKPKKEIKVEPKKEKPNLLEGIEIEEIKVKKEVKKKIEKQVEDLQGYTQTALFDLEDFEDEE